MTWRLAVDYEVYCLSTGPDGGSESEISGWTAVLNRSTLTPSLEPYNWAVIKNSVTPSTTRTFNRVDLNDQENFESNPGPPPFGGARLLIQTWHDMGDNETYPDLRVYVREEYAGITERGTRDVCNWALNTNTLAGQPGLLNWHDERPGGYEGYRFGVRWRLRFIPPIQTVPPPF